MPRAPEPRGGGDEAFGDYEFIGIGPISPDEEHPVPNLGLLEIDPPAHTGDDGPARPSPAPPRWRSGGALALAFVLGLTSAIVASRAPGDAAADAPVALTAGPVSVEGEIVPLTAPRGRPSPCPQATAVPSAPVSPWTANARSRPPRAWQKYASGPTPWA